MIRIELQSRTVLDALGEIMHRMDDPRPALIEIGEAIANSTRQRFRDGKGPDGVGWKKNERSTEEIYAGLFASSGTKKPLIGESRRLAGEISWQLTGKDAVEVGSPMPYAAMQQFGGKKSQWPHLWGDIPARPYLGISKQDESTILEIVGRYFGAA